MYVHPPSSVYPPAQPSCAAITRIGKKLNARQFVIATAIIYFRRFYVKNALAETDA